MKGYNTKVNNDVTMVRQLEDSKSVNKSKNREEYGSSSILKETYTGWNIRMSDKVDSGLDKVVVLDEDDSRSIVSIVDDSVCCDSCNSLISHTQNNESNHNTLPTNSKTPQREDEDVFLDTKKTDKRLKDCG